jgi:hypothetical protein
MMSMSASSAKTKTDILLKGFLGFFSQVQCFKEPKNAEKLEDRFVGLGWKKLQKLFCRIQREEGSKL